jgi:2-octaprenyl-6-methoxyphenol hydroxylase
MKIGFIGLGIMGRPMALNLRAAGHELVVPERRSLTQEIRAAATVVGDAAHGIHPIAGQGLNLGLRDVATLAEVLVEGKRLGLDLGDPALLERYQRWRGLDTFMVAAATDTLTRLFGIPGKTASAVRRFGISAVDRLPPLKDRFMAEARGESGTLPKLLQGLLV